MQKEATSSSGLPPLDFATTPKSVLSISDAKLSFSCRQNSVQTIKGIPQKNELVITFNNYFNILNKILKEIKTKMRAVRTYAAHP